MSMLEQLYQELILDHYKAPRHRGKPEQSDVHVHHSNPLCGDELDLWLTVTPDGKGIAAINYDGDGCSISMASASAMTEAIGTQTVEETLALIESFRGMMHGEPVADEEALQDSIAFSGVAKFPVRVKCALLGWMALKDAIANVQAGNTSNVVTYDESGEVQ